MKRNNSLYILIIFLLLSGHSFGQQFFRLKADISIERKDTKDSTDVWVGKSYFDKNSKKLVYQLTFPSSETWLFTDTSIVKVVDGKTISHQAMFNILDASIFSLALSGNLANNGMDNKVFLVKDVEKADSLVITTYGVNNPKMQGYEILVATKNKQLYGVVYQNDSGKVVSQKFFEDYININGFQFPSKVTQIFYKDGKEAYEVDKYSNIKLNELDEENIYNYIPPEN